MLLQLAGPDYIDDAQAALLGTVHVEMNYRYVDRYMLIHIYICTLWNIQTSNKFY